MRPQSSVRFAALLAFAAIGAQACGDPTLLTPPDDMSVASGLGGGAPTSSSQGAGGDGGQGGDGGLDGEGGSPPPVWVGLVANPRDDDPASNVEEVEAVVSTFAVGASVFASQRTWNAAAAAGAFDVDARLAAAGCANTPCRPAALTIAIVDGRLDGRPAELQGQPWASEASTEALDATIDAAFESLGPALKFLALGARVDRWVEEHEDDADDLEVLLAHAVGRALEHPDARADLLVGVGLSGEAALATEGYAGRLRALGNATMASLFPGLDEVADGALVPSPGSITLDLDAIDDVSPGRPVGLIEVGYPSSPLVGGGSDAQGLFVDALFEALSSRRASFPLVVVSRLHDLGAEACADEGARLGEDDELVRAYRCSTGARDEAGAPKAAWSSFVVGAARLATGATP